jgi:uncharacterized membrane protein YeiH
MVFYILSLLGVAVFAISGCLAAGRKGFDWVGVIVVAFVTALGGGTLRDILLGREVVFWIQDPVFLWIILISAAFTLVYARIFKPPYKLLLIADAMGLALFSILGAQVAQEFTSSPIIIVLMGAMTGAAGGIFRDLLLNEIPLLCKPSEPLYSTTAIFGVSVYLICQYLKLDSVSSLLTGIASTAILRLSAIMWDLRLPAFRLKE